MKISKNPLKSVKDKINKLTKGKKPMFGKSTGGKSLSGLFGKKSY